jgi:hypothetical protein
MVAYRPGEIVTAQAPGHVPALSLNGWWTRSASTSGATAADTRTLTYRSPRLLDGIQKGQPKARVFETFATAFVERDGKIVEVHGMRLRASGRSGTDTRVEVGEVLLAEGDEPRTPYWFLFEDGRLVAWGPPEQWDAAITAHALDVPYHPASAPRPSEARVELVSGR